MHKTSLIILQILYSLICLTVLLTAQPVSVEKQLLEIVDKNNKEALELLKKVVNINSGTMNFAGVKKVGDIFLKELDNLGFKTRWIDGTSFQRSGHLIAEHPGEGKHLLLIGHLDTVFEPDSPFQKFKMLDNNRMLGPGVCDMKGGDVIIIYALKALKTAGLLQKMNITVFMTGDEEKNGSPVELARYDLIEAAKAADIAIGFENGDGDPTTAVITRRGSSAWKLTVTGKPAIHLKFLKMKWVQGLFMKPVEF